MTLSELCEPLFQYVCMLNRIARSAGGEGMTYEALRPAIDSVFEGMEQGAAADPRLKTQFDKMRLPLTFFVDSVLSESKLSLAPVWNKNRMAYEQNELAGDEKFFDLIDQDLNDPSAEADERLAVYYTCLGLGFTGWYAGQPEYLRAKMNVLGARLKKAMETDARARLNPEAYQSLDTRNLVEPAGVRLAVVAIIFGACLVFVTAMSAYLFNTASRGLSDSIREILTHDLSEKK